MGYEGHIKPVMDTIPFIKMHGLGNDFVVIDARQDPVAVSSGGARAIADRHHGIGCDQVILIEPSADGLGDVFMRILNADGGEVAACGNATRCVASLLMAEKGADHVVIETAGGLLDAEKGDGGLICVDMGRARLDWRDIPLSEATDTLHLPISENGLTDGCAVNMGNPHLVFFVEDVDAIPLEVVGPKLERHKMFPQRTNVGIARVMAPDRLRLRVWERGAGITQACGSGACAALVAANRRGLCDKKAEIELDGGVLTVEWLNDEHVLMTGPVATSFHGALDSALLSGDGS